MVTIAVYSQIVGPLGVWQPGTVVKDCPEDLASGLVELGKASLVVDAAPEPAPEPQPPPPAPEEPEGDEDPDSN